MLKKIDSRDLPSIALVSGLCAVFCFNVAVGLTKGFDRPEAGFLVRLLAAPGIALGWGGVLLLLVTIPYALLAWIRGRRAGKLLSIGGAVVFALAVGALVAVFTTPATAGGGKIAGAIGAYLKGSLGAGFAAMALVVVSIPALLLGLAPLILESGLIRTAERVANEPIGAPKPWYPERKVGADGDEEPVQFTNAHDVGPIRFRDESEGPPTPLPAVSTVSLSPPPLSGPAAKKHRPIAGIRFADEAEAPDAGSPAVSDAPAEPEAAPAADVAPASLAEPDEPPLPNGVRYAPRPLAEPVHAVISSAPEANPTAWSSPAPTDDPAPADVEREEPAASTSLEADLENLERDPATPAEPPSRSTPEVAGWGAALAGLHVAAHAAEAHVAVHVAEAPALARASGSSVRASESVTPAAAVAAIAPAASVLAAVARVPATSAVAAPEAPATAVMTPRLIAPSSSARRASAPRSPAAVIAAALEIGIPASEGSHGAAGSGASTAIAAGESYRRKLASTGLIDSPPPEFGTPAVARPSRSRPRPARPKDVHDAIRGLFSSLPLEELPPVQPVIDPPEPAHPSPVDAPGQTTLFDASAKAMGRHPHKEDPLFLPSVDAAIERGSASLVLLKRKLGIGYARAASLIEALVAEGILGEMTASGSRPTLVTASEWERRSKAARRR